MQNGASSFTSSMYMYRIHMRIQNVVMNISYGGHLKKPRMVDNTIFNALIMLMMYCTDVYCIIVAFVWKMIEPKSLAILS